MTLLLCDRLALDPVPFLLAEVMASNIGGTATLIGDPPNIIIGSRADLGFNDFLDPPGADRGGAAWWCSSGCAGCCGAVGCATTPSAPRP